jgi:hypothetical protein
MGDKQTFADGFLAGFFSVMGPRVIIPKISTPPVSKIGSDYIHGLMQGIEAAKKQIVEMATSNNLSNV